MNKQAFLGFLAMTLVMVALAVACSPSIPAASPSPANLVPPTASSASASATTSQPASGVTPKPTEPATAGLRPITWPKQAGLDRLPGYRLTLSRSFKGTQNGQPAETSTAYTLNYRKNPPAQFTTADTRGPDGKPIKLMFGYVGEVVYQQVGADQPCTASAKAADLREWNPGAALAPVSQAKLVGPETVNRVPTQHYTLDASSLGKNWPADTSGDLYLADPAGYVVKYILQVKAGESYFGKGNQGEQTTAFEVLTAGEQGDLALPAGCPALANLPAMPSASDVVRTPWGVSYLAASSTAQVLAYYRAEMQARGWEEKSNSEDASTASFGLTETGTPIPTAQAAAPKTQSLERGWMVWTLAKEKKMVYISVTPEGGRLRVDVQVDDDVAIAAR